MTERDRGAADPSGGSSAAESWYRRMEGETTRLPAQPDPVPPWGAGGTAPGAAAGAPPPARDTTPVPPARPPRRRRREPSAGVIWWALGALVLVAAAIVAISLGDPPDTGRTPTADTRSPASTSTGEASTTPSSPTSGPSTSGQATPSSSGTAATDSGTASAGPSGTGDDPLGVGSPMASPACDGTWVVILGSATDPASYAADVTALLGTDSGAKYVRTQGACGSLRQALPDGGLIYAVWAGPYPDQAAACAARGGFGDGTYVKRMDDSTPPDQTWEC